MFLCLAMVLSTVGADSPAGGTDPAAEGLCEHHPAHTPECGYEAPSEGSPYTHVHDESCGYVAPTPETPCDMGCTDTDGDGVIDHADGCAYTPASEGSPCTHIHDESCGYAEATAGSPCQFVCEICAAETPDPDAAETPAPEGDPGMGDPDMDGDIAPIAIADPTVTIKEASDSAGTTSQPINEAAEITCEHNKVYQLAVSANYNGVTDGKVRVTIAPGLKITGYYKETSSSGFTSVEATKSAGNIEGYTFPVAYDTLEYMVSNTAAAINLDVNLAVDTVLWPKIDGWKLENAIQVVFLEGDTVTTTKTANVTVDRATNETDPNWNKLYSSDSNNSVPGTVGTDFKMKVFQVSPNLHGSPLGFFYPELKVTIPLPKTETGDTYARYSRVECSQTSPEPTAVPDTDNHTVTFTWKNIYVPANSTFTFTPISSGTLRKWPIQKWYSPM